MLPIHEATGLSTRSNWKMSQSSPTHTRSVIAFMTDFGLGDGTTGVLKGVVLGIAPNAQLIDITHTIASQNIASGAWILATSYPYFPAKTVFVCVVDPGVGSTRRPIAIHAGNWFFVGPDNGLFSYVLAEQPIHQAVMLCNTTYHLPQISSTFHGRDIFSPVAAHIANGISLAELGPQIDPATLHRLELEQATRQGTRIDGRVLHVDHFGNLVTNIPLSLVPDLFSATKVEMTFPAQGIVITERRHFFSEPSSQGKQEDKKPFIYGDSSGYLGVAVRNDSASAILHIDYNATITLILE